MKLNKNYMLKNVAGSDVVVALGEEAVKLHGMITLNETAAFIWRCLEKELDEEQILALLKEEYTGADEERLKNDTDVFLKKLIDRNILIP